MEGPAPSHGHQTQRLQTHGQLWPLPAGMLWPLPAAPQGIGGQGIRVAPPARAVGEPLPEGTATQIVGRFTRAADQRVGGMMRRQHQQAL